MMTEIALASLIGPCVIAYTLLYLLLKFDSRLLAYDRPTERGLHDRVVPRGGGVIIIVATGLCSAGLSLAGIDDGLDWPIVLALSGIAVMGFADDHFGLSIRLRLLAGFALAGVVGIATVGGEQWVLFGASYPWQPEFVILPVVLGLVWLMNLFNFMDGADGVAGVQALIGTAVLAVWFALSNYPSLALMNLGVAGACLGFLVFNWAPARVFLGDVGSLTLGAWFGCMLLIGTSRAGIPLEAFFILLGIFWFDATYTLIRRLLSGAPITEAHREHLYQRLILANWSHQKVALSTAVLALVMAVLASAVTRTPENGLWFFLLALAILLGYTALVTRLGTKDRSPGET
ncbi:MAG: glycosyltransferase family 4 protein [Arenicellales bacterium]|nr:glycosyltransferase family 4 protein [Arenicellales bacterium]MDP6791002.1 glycosyltransferase family 4 protein [Arenicellales bacterium]MDP6918548.1 glycosyltransferase family 4 protein [Arenicellales bacterium]